MRATRELLGTEQRAKRPNRNVSIIRRFQTGRCSVILSSKTLVFFFKKQMR